MIINLLNKATYYNHMVILLKLKLFIVNTKLPMPKKEELDPPKVDNNEVIIQSFAKIRDGIFLIINYNRNIQCDKFK